MTTANHLDNHIRETADLARTAMADMLAAVATSAQRCSPGGGSCSKLKPARNR
jgi:hypothetical protein